MNQFDMLTNIAPRGKLGNLAYFVILFLSVLLDDDGAFLQVLC